MRFASLGSGSRGNSLVVEAGGTRILLDCGFGPRQMEARLDRLGFSASDIAAVFLTHEHADHVAGVWACARRYRYRVFLTHGTLTVCDRNADGVDVTVIDSHDPVVFRGLELQPFPVPHDAREPVQYVISDGIARLGVLTDVGEPTVHLERMLTGCDGLVLECNHDEEMLANGTYPPVLKRRIAGRHGHLSNRTAAGLLERIRGDRLRCVVAAHLSEENNRPALARRALANALGCSDDDVTLADQSHGCDWQVLA